MKKNLLNVTVFLILFVSLYGFLTVLKHPIDHRQDIITGFYAEKNDTLDMVYIGGSAAFVYYSPLQAYSNYGIASYVYGTDTIQAEMYIAMIEEIYKTQRPELIVIDARAYQYRDFDQPPTDVAYRNLLTNMKFSKNRYDLIEKTVPKYLKHDTLSYHLDLRLYHSNKERPSLSKVKKILLNQNKHPLKGLYLVPKAEPQIRLDNKSNYKKAISKETENILVELLDYLDNKKIKALFVVSPYIQTKEEKENYNYIENIIKSRNYLFLDANEYYGKMNIDFYRDFYNYAHVNIFGAEKYTDFLSTYIKNNYQLKDVRNMNKYYDWTKLMDNYHLQIKNTKNDIMRIISDRGYDGRYNFKR